jgi:hypothetical protein
MKTKRRVTPEPVKPGPPAFPLREDVSVPTADRRTLTLKLDDSGAPVWDKFTPPVREAWEKVLAHDSTKAAFGVAKVAEPGEISGPVLEAETARAMFDVLAQAEAVLFSALWKLPYAEVLPILTFSPDEKSLCVPPAMRLAEKYGKELLAKWGDEITLAALVGMIFLQKARAVSALAKSKKVSAESPSKQKTTEEEDGALPLQQRSKGDGGASVVPGARVL